MSDSKKKASPKPKAVKEAPKKKAPKEEVAKAPKKPKAKTLGELKKEFVSARKANPEKSDALRSEYLEAKKALKASY
tara:strand:+ start:1401 stop:1631 length:231 start_codon:yes stop_codon:yes gene_type:complete